MGSKTEESEVKKPIPTPPPAPIQKVAIVKRYVVAKGRSIIAGSKSGILGEGEEVIASYLSPDIKIAEASLKRLIETGIVDEKQ